VHKIRTLLGDILPGELGVCDFHDHLIRTGGPELNITMDYLMDSIPAAKAELDEYLKAGGKSMLCMDPIGCGRDVPKMLEIANSYAGKAHLIMCTGFHKGTLYDQRHHWLVTYPIEWSVKLLVAEIEEGMDKYSYNGPLIERCGAKAGIIKTGTSHLAILPFEKKALTVAAITQQQTGAAISVHTQMGTMGREILKFLQQQGADIEHTVLCHIQRNPDKYYLESLLETGACICFDGLDRDVMVAELLTWLVEKGYKKQIVLAMDAGRYTYQKAYMAEKNSIANGIAYMLTDFVPLLRKIGVEQDVLDDILIHNAERVLAF
jgi:5-phospho-D-xylono-1,4-lactonase